MRELSILKNTALEQELEPREGEPGENGNAGETRMKRERP